MRFVFGDIVVVNNEIGVVVKRWSTTAGWRYEVYNKRKSEIVTYDQNDLSRYQDKYFAEEGFKEEL